ncbi:uncharacterized protein [Procambarus clarkii]|uniref:uncharacterized protein n=1 Tax=Procambarus clarkii TaxID=6728 RepID=UPI001E677223|nr:uncharacterized protein LOC123772310 [Procambarus clarkii]
MKLVLLACLAAVGAAAPHVQDGQPVVLILSDDGSFSYADEVDNNVAVEASDTNSEGQSNLQGIFKFPLPEEGFAEVRYIADGNPLPTYVFLQARPLPQEHPHPGSTRLKREAIKIKKSKSKGNSQEDEEDGNIMSRFLKMISDARKFVYSSRPVS